MTYITRELQKLIFRSNPHLRTAISAIGASVNLHTLQSAPTGSALMSFGGEIHLPIIHAAPASMMGSGPIRTASIVACVKNAIRVAAANGIKTIGMPFLGSGIFSKRILEYVDMDDNLRLARLAKLLIKSCKNSRDVSVCFFPWSEQELSYFDGRIATFFNKRAPGVLQGSLLYNTQNSSTNTGHCECRKHRASVWWRSLRKYWECHRESFNHHRLVTQDCSWIQPEPTQSAYPKTWIQSSPVSHDSCPTNDLITVFEASDWWGEDGDGRQPCLVPMPPRVLATRPFFQANEASDISEMLE